MRGRYRHQPRVGLRGFEAGQVGESKHVGRIEQQQIGEEVSTDTPRSPDQQPEQGQIEHQHEQEPHDEGQAGGTRFFADAHADQIGQCDEYPAEQDRRDDKEPQRLPQMPRGQITGQRGDCDTGQTEAERGGEGEHGRMTGKLAGQ